MTNRFVSFMNCANTPPVELGGASRRNCTTNFSWIALVLPLWQSRSDSVSIVSRQSVLAILLMLLTLFVGVGQVRAEGTETFENVANATNRENLYY